MPEYVAIAEARRRGGLRLVVPAIAGPPWSESAKAVLDVKGLPYVRVAQQPMETNEALREWTGFSNAPIGACSVPSSMRSRSASSSAGGSSAHPPSPATNAAAPTHSTHRPTALLMPA